MCLVLYLGSVKQGPLIDWDESALRFHVKQVATDAKMVLARLQKPIVHNLGSDNGCGCGIRQEHDAMIDGAEHLTSKTVNQTMLRD